MPAAARLLVISQAAPSVWAALFLVGWFVFADPPLRYTQSLSRWLTEDSFFGGTYDYAIPHQGLLNTPRLLCGRKSFRLTGAFPYGTQSASCLSLMHGALTVVRNLSMRSIPTVDPLESFCCTARPE